MSYEQPQDQDPNEGVQEMDIPEDDQNEDQPEAPRDESTENNDDQPADDQPSNEQGGRRYGRFFARAALALGGLALLGGAVLGIYGAQDNGDKLVYPIDLDNASQEMLGIDEMELETNVDLDRVIASILDKGGDADEDETNDEPEPVNVLANESDEDEADETEDDNRQSTGLIRVTASDNSDESDEQPAEEQDESEDVEEQGRYVHLFDGDNDTSLPMASMTDKVDPLFGINVPFAGLTGSGELAESLEVVARVPEVLEDGTIEVHQIAFALERHGEEGSYFYLAVSPEAETAFPVQVYEGTDEDGNTIVLLSLVGEEEDESVSGSDAPAASVPAAASVSDEDDDGKTWTPVNTPEGVIGESCDIENAWNTHADDPNVADRVAEWLATQINLGRCNAVDDQWVHGNVVCLKATPEAARKIANDETVTQADFDCSSPVGTQAPAKATAYESETADQQEVRDEVYDTLITAEQTVEGGSNKASTSFIIVKKNEAGEDTSHITNAEYANKDTGEVIQQVAAPVNDHDVDEKPVASISGE